MKMPDNAVLVTEKRNGKLCENNAYFTMYKLPRLKAGLGDLSKADDDELKGSLAIEEAVKKLLSGKIKSAHVLVKGTDKSTHTVSIKMSNNKVISSGVVHHGKLQPKVVSNGHNIMHIKYFVRVKSKIISYEITFVIRHDPVAAK
jgi:VCBS repeat-containing protein